MALLPNEPVPLSVQLSDMNLYPRATIYGPNNAQVAGSPVALPYLAKGNYGTSSFLMPNLAWIKVVYEIFTDSSFVNLSGIYGNSVDIFELDQGGGGGGGGSVSTGGQILTGEIAESQEVMGELLTQPQELIGVIENE